MSDFVPDELRVLRTVFQLCDPVPECALDAAYAAARFVSSEGSPATEVLELVADSADTPGPALTRGADRTSRVLTYALPGRVLEMDLIPTVPGMLTARGIVLDRAGSHGLGASVTLRHPDGDHTGVLDRHAAFRIDDVPAGPLSVMLRPTGSTPLVADWLVC